MASPDRVADTIRYNYESYARHYSQPLVDLRYDLIYRQHRIARLLHDAGIDPKRPGFAAFEYGFGAGHLLEIVAGASRVVGFEFSPSAVTKAKNLAPTGHPDWDIREHADAKKLGLPSGEFDLVTASHVLEHLDDDEGVLDELQRLVRPGGHLLIILPAHEELFTGSKHLRLYDVEEFRRRLRERDLEEVAVDQHQRFDRPWKHYRVILQSRRGLLWKALIEGSKAALFLPPLAVSWKVLRALDELLGRAGAKSTSVAYLFRKRADGVSKSEEQPA